MWTYGEVLEAITDEDKSAMADILDSVLQSKGQCIDYQDERTACTECGNSPYEEHSWYCANHPQWQVGKDA